MNSPALIAMITLQSTGITYSKVSDIKSRAPDLTVLVWFPYIEKTRNKNKKHASDIPRKRKRNATRSFSWLVENSWYIVNERIADNVFRAIAK